MKLLVQILINLTLLYDLMIPTNLHLALYVWWWCLFFFFFFFFLELHLRLYVLIFDFLLNSDVRRISVFVIIQQ